MRHLVAAVLGTAVLSACSGTAAPEPAAAPTPTAVPPALALSPAAPDDPWRALSLVPASATVVTLTNWDLMRERFGLPDLDGASAAADRASFRTRASREASLLDEGLLHGDGGDVWGTHGIGEDDVDWEVRFEGPDGAGWIVALRPTLSAGLVRAAASGIKDARVLDGGHVVARGAARAGELVWAADPLAPRLTDATAETAYLRRGCVPVRTALGRRAKRHDYEAVRTEVDPRLFRPLEAFSVSFGQGIATARLGLGRTDLLDRADLAEAWPRIPGAPGFLDGFAADALVDPSTGRIGLRISDAPAAADVALADLLPFAVCNDDPLEDWSAG